MGRKKASSTTTTASSPEQSTPAAVASTPSDAAATTKRRKKPNTGSFDTYIYKVLKETYPELGISHKSMVVLDSLCLDLFERICTEASSIARYTKKQTLSSKDVQCAVRLVLRGELSKHAMSMGIKSVNNFVSSSSGGEAIEAGSQ